MKDPSPTCWHQDIVGYILSESCHVVDGGRTVASPINVFIDEALR